MYMYTVAHTHNTHTYLHTRSVNTTTIRGESSIGKYCRANTVNLLSSVPYEKFAVTPTRLVERRSRRKPVVTYLLPAPRRLGEHSSRLIDLTKYLSPVSSDSSSVGGGGDSWPVFIRHTRTRARARTHTHTHTHTRARAQL